jgi:flagellar hook-associated protein 3 FlgL
MRIKNGNGTFVTQASAVPANTGSGVISAGSVTNPAALTGNNYSVTFSGGAGAQTYSVTNTTTGIPVAGQTTQPYVAGRAIAFDGLQFTVEGAPSGGDSFAVSPSANVSLFKTLSDMITSLNAPVVGSSLTNALNTGMTNLDNALGSVLNTRANLGLRLNEIDALQLTGDNMSLQIKQSLSTLQDTNVTQAISDLTQQQTSLQAAQKTFAQVSSLTLFTYI